MSHTLRNMFPEIIEKTDKKYSLGKSESAKAIRPFSAPRLSQSNRSFAYESYEVSNSVSARQNLTLTKDAFNKYQHKSLLSVQDNNIGWFPSGLTHTRKELSRKQSIANNWIDGTLLSELVAVLIIDHKDLVKQVDHFDEFGRLQGPPKLMLVGTEPNTKSRAQVLNNIRQCLKVLRLIPSLPRVSYCAEELVDDHNKLKKLIQDLTSYFHIPMLDMRGDTPTYIAFNHRSILPVRHQRPRARSAPPAVMRSTNFNDNKLNQSIRSVAKSPLKPNRGTPSSDIAYRDPSLRHREVSPQGYNREKSRSQEVRSSRSLSKRLPSSKATSRDSSPNIIVHKRTSRSRDSSREGRIIQEDTPVKTKVAPIPYFRRIKSPSRWREEQTSPEPRHRPPAPVHLSGGDRRLHDSSAKSSESALLLRKQDANTQSNIAVIRQREARRERLRVQQRDRVIRRSKLLQRDEDRENDHGNTSYTGDQFKSTRELSEKSPSLVKQRAPSDCLSEFVDVPSSGASLSPPEQYFAPITPAQQKETARWMASMGAPDFSAPSSSSSAPSPSLPSDTLRNGVALVSLLSLLEPHMVRQAGLLQRIHRAPRTLQQALKSVSLVQWLLRVTRSPPLPVALLADPRAIVAGNKDAIWGLFWELYQLYGSPSSGASAAMDIMEQQAFGPRDISFDPKVGLALPYSPVQRRALDVSLLQWLRGWGMCDEALFTSHRFNSLQSIISLEGALSDGSLFCQVVTKLLFVPLRGQRQETAFESSSRSRPPPIITFHACPRTVAQRQSNIRAVLAGLRACAGFPVRCLRCESLEEQILAGRWDAILALLEDMHLFHDLLLDHYQFASPRDVSALKLGDGLALKPRPLSIRYPYLGPKGLHRAHKEEGLRQQAELDSRLADISRTEGVHQLAAPQSSPSPLPRRYSLSQVEGQGEGQAQGEGEEARGGETEEEALTLVGAAAGGRATLFYDNQAPRSSNAAADKSHGDSFSFAHGQRSPVTVTVSRAAAPSPLRSASDLASRDAALNLLLSPHKSENPSIDKRLDRDQDTEINVSLDIGEVDKLSQALSLDGSDSDDGGSDGAASERGDRDGDAGRDGDDRQATVRRAGSRFSSPALKSGDGDILKWLEKVFGPGGGKFSFDNVGERFRDGTLLGRLVQIIERGPGVPGLEPRPRHTAHRLQNIRRVFEHLAQSNKRIPLRILSCEEEVLRGDCQTVLSLLQTIRKAYPTFRP